MRTVCMALSLALIGCGSTAKPLAEQPPVVQPPVEEAPLSGKTIDAAKEAINKVLDDWHAAAARADEEAYFGLMTDDAIFLGTDATERWDVPAFRTFAHPHFAKGKAWSFRATRRGVMIGSAGHLAWFDEDLATPNLGPARGSGVLRKQPNGWRIVHYNLTITVPNDRFKEVKALLDTAPPSQP